MNQIGPLTAAASRTVPRGGDNGPGQQPGGANAASGADERARIAIELASLTTRLQEESPKNAALVQLQTYLGALRVQAEAAGVNTEADGASSLSAAPDSAIDMTEELAFPSVKEDSQRRATSFPIDELLDGLDDIPARAPTPPPKAHARQNSRPKSVLPAPRPGIADDRDPFLTVAKRRSDVQQPSVPTRGSSLRPFDVPHRRAESFCTAVTVLGFDDTKSAGEPKSPNPAGRVARFLGQVRNVLPRPRSSSGAAPRSDRRLSVFRPLSFYPKAETAEPAEAPEPDTVFGVSLSKSMQIAKTSARTHHTGSGSSRRDFPLCVLSCAAHIKSSGGILAPDIFGMASDAERVAALREAFSAPPAYGADLDWAAFTPYDAAELILLFLSELPRPLVPESVARRWIALSRQAMQVGSDAVRLEQCIDFWEEALGGIRGAARSLLKLLLNLWGEVADAAHENDMTAERLAGRILRPLMHIPPGKYTTDYMLGLAFLIRRRSEYSLLLAGGVRKSNAAFE